MQAADNNGYTVLLYAMVNCDESMFNLYGSQLVKSGASLTALQTVLLDGMKRSVPKVSAGRLVTVHLGPWHVLSSRINYCPVFKSSTER